MAASKPFWLEAAKNAKRRFLPDEPVDALPPQAAASMVAQASRAMLRADDRANRSPTDERAVIFTSFLPWRSSGRPLGRMASALTPAQLAVNSTSWIRTLSGDVRRGAAHIFRLVKMYRQRLQRGTLVPPLETVDDRLVLVDDLVQMPLVAHRAQPHEAHETSQLAEEPRHHSQPCSRRDGQMQLLVEIDERLLVACLCRPLLPPQKDPELIDLVHGHDVAGLGNGDPLQRLSNLDELVAMFDGHA